mgnify:CR=1 FL=1
MSSLDRVRLVERTAPASGDGPILNALHAILDEQRALRLAASSGRAAESNSITVQSELRTFPVNVFQSIVEGETTQIGVAGPIGQPFAIVNVAMMSSEIRDATCDFLRPAVRIAVSADNDTTVMNGFEIFGQYRTSSADNLYLSPGMVFSAPMFVPILLREQFVKARVQNLQEDDVAVSILLSTEIHPEWDD